jgi:hypothetical protein
MDNNSDKKISIAPEARMALDQMKAEVARELSITKPEEKDRANMVPKRNGYLGDVLKKYPTISNN